MDRTMEARTQARLDAQEEQIHKLTGHLASLTQQVTVLQKSQEKFQGAVFQWMKKLDKLQMMDITDREITFNDLYSFSKLVEWKSIIQSSEIEGMKASKDENSNKDVDAGEEETDNNNDDSDDAEERDEGPASVKMGDVAIINGEKKNIWRKEKPAKIEQIRANIGLSYTQRTLVLRESAMITTRNAEGVLGRKGGQSSDYRNRGGGKGEGGEMGNGLGSHSFKQTNLGAQFIKYVLIADPQSKLQSSNSDYNKEKQPTMQNVETCLYQFFQPQPAHISSLTQRHKGALHLTYAELGKRRRKGLCFEYGQPFSPQHRCLEGQFRVILLNYVEKPDEAIERKICKTTEDDENLTSADGECQILSNTGLSLGYSRNKNPIVGKRSCCIYQWYFYKTHKPRV